MCVTSYRVYTCGCKKEEGFDQCAKRLGTNVLCHPGERENLEPRLHMCRNHLVKPGMDEMVLNPAPQSNNINNNSRAQRG
ncbi:hypothetical protein F4860DRAFT_480949 [Xylaria cubensis]|nr:hypothetical protein F4860DRAFT_480949 [Xylaria cubensis]